MSISARVAELFGRASELPADERRAFLSEACGEDESLYREVSSLLAAAEESGDYFEQLSGKVGLSALAEDDAPLPENKVIGSWRLEGIVGRGGMGAVYRVARADDHYEQKAALKLLPIGLDSGTSRARFLAERQILAGLSHGNIARLIDGGVTDDGTPYFVMEYVDGEPIIDYCDRHRLTINARIRLFLDVLAAVSHAHRRLIIHRDLKPSNVLVDAGATVKLLDFGVAKLLRADAAGVEAGLTVDSAGALTPEYAAPEQLLGQDVTTATDVYSLGLMLYELLSGYRPRGPETVDSFATLVGLATRDLPRASSVAAGAERRASTLPELQRRLRGDLDTVLHKALAPEPDDRYPTVDRLAGDLERFLAGEPVSAMPPTLGYQLRKFVGRHRGGVAATAVAGIALLASLVVATLQMIEARKQRDAAIYHQQRVLASNEFMTQLLGEIGPAGEPLTLGELLDRGVDMLERSFGDENRLLGHMYFDLAESHLTFGKGRRAVELLSSAERVARDSGDNDLLAGVLCLHGTILYASEFQMSDARVTEANALLDNLDTTSNDTLAACARANAARLERRGENGAAIEVLQDAVASLDASGFASVQTRVRVLNNLIALHHAAGQLDEALDLNQQVLDLMRRSGRGASTEYVINALNRSVLMASVGEVRAANAVREDIIRRMGVFERIEELQATGRAPIATLAIYAGGLIDLGRYDAARRVLDEALIAARNANHVLYTARGELNRARLLIREGNSSAAIGHIDIAAQAIADGPASYRLLQRDVELVRASAMLHSGNLDAARRVVEAELERLGYPARYEGPLVAAALKVAAEVAIADRRAADAERYASEYYELARLLARDARFSADVGRALLLRAKACLLQGNLRAAREDLEGAAESLGNGLGEDHPLTREARKLLSTRV